MALQISCRIFKSSRISQEYYVLPSNDHQYSASDSSESLEGSSMKFRAFQSCDVIVLHSCAASNSVSKHCMMVSGRFSVLTRAVSPCDVRSSMFDRCPECVESSVVSP